MKLLGVRTFLASVLLLKMVVITMQNGPPIRSSWLVWGVHFNLDRYVPFTVSRLRWLLSRALVIGPKTAGARIEKSD